MALLSTLFHGGTQPMLGLDISSSSVKLVELSRDKSGKYTLERCVLEPLEQGWVNDGNIENFDAVNEAVQRVVRASGTRTRRAAFALPPSAVITKKIMLPADLSESEMEVQVEAEASQYIPFSLDEVSLDFCVIGPSQSSAQDVEVLLAASRKEKVLDRQALAEGAGLIPVIVDVDAYAARLAAQRLIDLSGKDAEPSLPKTVALFEIGAFSTGMQVLSQENTVYERTLAFGGAQLTQSVARQYGFTPQEAETKKRHGDVPADFATTLVPQYVESIAGEISRALQLFLTSTSAGRVDRVLLGGGGANVAGLAEQVARQTGAPASIANPFRDMAMGRGVREQRVKSEAPSYLTACGLALRRFFQ